MKKIYLSFSLLFTVILTFAQDTQRGVIHLTAQDLNQSEIWLEDGKLSYRASSLVDIPLGKADPFIAYSVVWYAEDWTENDRLTAWFSDGTRQSAPVQVMPDPHAASENGKYISQLYFTEKEQQKFRLQYTGQSKIDRVEVHFFNPGKSTEITPSTVTVDERGACPCPLPALVERDGWCPGGSCPPDPTPVPTNVTHLIIHHSAGSNSSSDWAAVVRSIWDFHVNVNGWDDIGYNYLIDPHGILYEGRGNDRLGAHFCSTNGGTMGVCVMGDFTNIQPTQDALDMLAELFSWKACDKNIDPLGSGFHSSSGEDIMYVSGHRDGCATACPGDSFYPLLPNVRDAIQDRIDNVCNGLVINAPGSLNAEAISNNAVEVTWEDNSDNEDGFVLERSVSFNNNFMVLTTLPANTVGYDDYDVIPFTGYFYRIKAIQGTFSSLYSNEDFTATNMTATESLHLNGSTVTIAPNPVTDRATISVENSLMEDLGYTLFDVTGKQILRDKKLEKSGETVSFDVGMSTLPAGVYWIRITQSGEAALFQLIKQ